MRHAGRCGRKVNVQAGLIQGVNSHWPSGLITEHGTCFRELFMKTQAYTQAIERPSALIERAPVMKRLDAPLLAIMFNLLEGRDRWRRLPILRLLTS
jgi:hypothetical protein